MKGFFAPIGHLALATNANRTLVDFFAGGIYTPRTSVATLATAMDIGAPNNFERLCWMIPDIARLRSSFTVDSLDDPGIRDTIRATWQRYHVAVCPHTATALGIYGSLQQHDDRPWAIAATAHPAKFETVVEPLIGETIPLPPSLAELLGRPSRSESLAVNYNALAKHLNSL